MPDADSPRPVAAFSDDDHQVAELSARLRLKRWFLRSLVASLVACALLAVVALLIGEFNETTARILLTLAALALHSGIAMTCAAWLEKRFCSMLARVGLFLFAANFALFAAAIWWPGGLGDSAGRAMLTTAALIGYFVLSIPAADLYERRQDPLIWASGLPTCALGLAMLLICIWAQDTKNIAFAKATATVAVCAFTLAQLALLARIPATGPLRRVLFATIGAVVVLAGMAIAAIWLKIEDQLYYRVLGAVGVLDAAGLLSLVILARLRQVAAASDLQSAAPRVELVCPRCLMHQTLDAGRARCAACGLRITIELEEPRCAKCGYLLWQLPDRRCPECGTAF